MSIRSQIDRINANIADAYTEAEAKGATMPATENSANLAGTIAGISSLSFEIVTEKPVSDIKTNVIYLIPNGSSDSDDRYDEWIYISNAWERIGSTAIDLSQYAQRTELLSKADAPIIKHGALTPISTVNGKLYNFESETEREIASAAYSDFSVQQGNVYLISGYAGEDAAKYSLCGFYDSQDRLLQTFGTESVSGGKTYTDLAVTAPPNAVRVRVNGKPNSSSNPRPIACYLAEYDADCIPTIKEDLDETRTDVAAIAANTQNLVCAQNMLGVLPYRIQSGYYKPDGTHITNTKYECGVIELAVSSGDKFLYRGNGNGDAVSVLFYDSSDAVVSSEAWNKNDYHEVVIPSGVTKVLFTSFRNIQSTPALTFEAYKVGGIFNLYQTATNPAPSTQPAKTLNLTNRLYAAETMGTNKQLLPLDKAVFCVGFDDYNLDCLAAVEYLNSQQLPSYLSLIPDNVKDNWSMAHACYDNGGEIAAHSKDVLTNQNQTFEMMNDKFVDIPAKIGEAGFPVYGIIRAGGTDQGKENTLLDEFYCRASGLKYSDYYGPASSLQYNLTRKNLTNRTLEQWETLLNDLVTNKGYCISFCHHVNGTETSEAYPNGFTLNDFKAIISAVQERDIEVMTINEFVDRYIYGIDPTDAFVRT